MLCNQEAPPPPPQRTRRHKLAEPLADAVASADRRKPPAGSGLAGEEDRIANGASYLTVSPSKLKQKQGQRVEANSIYLLHDQVRRRRWLNRRNLFSAEHERRAMNGSVGAMLKIQINV